MILSWVTPFLAFEIYPKRVEADLKHPMQIYTGGEKLNIYYNGLQIGGRFNAANVLLYESLTNKLNKKNKNE